eukprot:CCRYP_005746-RA/>CCRYP_005746-RA protein AED:0.96 eAED:0.42 QI:0/-1/0/1/-1/1/1/0/173
MFAAPITLSVDEMKEMEELVMKKANQTLTKDSIFCNIDFTLGSFQVNLTTAENQPITSLEMDMMSTSFKAKADGSFAFILSLLSLEVSDSVTQSTFYPTIAGCLQIGWADCCLHIGWPDSSFAGHCQADHGDGCGDGPSLWAFDGWRRYHWHSTGKVKNGHDSINVPIELIFL